MRSRLLICGVVLAVRPVAAQVPHLVIQAPEVDPGQESMILTADVDFSAVVACYEQPTAMDTGAILAAVALPEGGYRALPTQYDPDPETADGRRGTVTIVLPREDSGKPLVVFFTRLDLPRPAPAGQPLQVTIENGVVTVRNTTYTVTHDPAKMGGLPSRIELRPSGKVFDTYSLNDRVYDKELGGWYIRDDKEPEVTLLANGPLRCVVQVKARYMRGDQQPDSLPRAVYRFAYYPDSPRVDVSIAVTQETGFPWKELHGIEINFPDESFPAWIGGDPPAEGKFEATNKGWQQAWGALADGDSLVGLLGGAKFYDGRGGYGTYVHGPWISWGGLSQRLDLALYLSGAPDSRQQMAAAAKAEQPSRQVAALPDVAVRLLERLAATADGQPAMKRSRIRWWAAIAGRMMRRGELASGWRLARRIEAEAPGLPARPGALDEWFAGQTGWSALASEQLVAGFAGPRLVSLYDVDAGRELLAEPSPLWRMSLRDADRKTQAYGPDTWASIAGADLADAAKLPGRARFAATRDGANGLVFRFEGFPIPSAGDAVGPTVTLWATVTGPRLATRIEVENDTAFSVMRTETPLVSLAPLGAAADDTMFLPVGPGVIYPDPLGHGSSRRGDYPQGWWAMQYSALYDRDGGLFIAPLDPYASTKTLYAQASAASRSVRFGCEWPMPDMSVAGNDWEQPGESVLEVFRGDWYDAAQVYRSWVEREAEWWPARAKERQTPAWVREIAIWALASGVPRDPNDPAKGVVPTTIAMAEYMGVPTALHWYSWHQIPFDDQYPHYNPEKPGVPEGVAELQAAGVKVMPYINARLWDSRLDDFKNEAIRSATVDESGEPYIEVYGSKVPLAPMCPVTDLWQDKVREIVLWIQNDVGTDGVYLDQVAAARPRLCYNPNHGHPLGGGHWWTTDGYWPLLRKLRAGMRPGKFITSECNAEPYMQFFDGYLTWHWQEQNMVPAFSAVYADQVVLFSRAYRGGQTRDLADRMKAAQSLCFGEQIGWINPDVIHRPSGPFVRRCARTRYLLNDFIAHGRMLHPPALEGEVPAVTADWSWRANWLITLDAVQTGAWRAADGRVALIFANFSPDEATARYTFDATSYGYPADAEIQVTRRTADGAEEPRTLTAAWSEELVFPAEEVVVYEVSAR